MGGIQQGTNALSNSAIKLENLCHNLTVGNLTSLIYMRKGVLKLSLSKQTA